MRVKNEIMLQLAKEVHTLRDTACWIEYVGKEDCNKRVNNRTFELKNKIQKLREENSILKKRTVVVTQLLVATLNRLS